MDDREFEDRLMPDLVRIHGEPLDPNLVAAYVDGALEEPELSEVRARVAQDPEALLLVRALSETGAPVAHSRPAMVLTAAAVVAALLLVALGASWFGRDEQVDAAGLDTRLTVAASNLGERRPDLFEGFTPFESDELSPRSTPARGGAVWIAPRGLLLTHPSELRWKNPPGATRVELVLAGPDIDWRRELDEERLPVADLGPGRYVITLRGLDTLAGQTLRRSFTVAAPEVSARHRQAFDVIDRVAPDDLRSLLRAHYALRTHLFVEAELKPPVGAKTRSFEPQPVHS